MPRRARLIAITGVVLVALAVALALVARSLLAPERFTALLARGVADAGLELHLAGPAHPALWPHPAVELEGLRLSLPGASDTPLVTARQLRLVLPWRGVFGGETRIVRLELQSPRADLAPLRAWLAARPAEAVAPVLPTVDTGVQVHDGELRNDGDLLLDGIGLDTGALRVDAPFDLTLHASDARGRPWSLDLHARPRGGTGIRLDPLRAQLSTTDGGTLDLDGRLDWQGGKLLSGTLEGSLHAHGRDYAVHLDLHSADAVELVLDGAGASVALSMSPRAAWQWWQATLAGEGAALPLPPVQGSLRTQSVKMAGWQVEGLRIDSGTAASTALPAAPATVSPGSGK